MKYIFKVIFGIIYSLKNSNEVEETYNDLRQIYQKKFLYMTIDKYSTYLNDITFNIRIDYEKDESRDYSLKGFLVNENYIDIHYH